MGWGGHSAAAGEVISAMSGVTDPLRAIYSGPHVPKGFFQPQRDNVTLISNLNFSLSISAGNNFFLKVCWTYTLSRSKYLDGLNNMEISF